MDPLQIGVLGSVLMVALFLIGVPIAYSMGLVGVIGMALVFDPMMAFEFAPQKIHTYLASFSFTAIPLFILMGFFALHAGLTKDAFIAARLWLAKLPGGLASACVGASALFAACSGSGLPAAIALGKIAVPEMVELGYDRGLAAGVVASATPLAVLIPPSMLMIVFGILTETSVARLLIAGIVPGILASAVMIIGITIRAALQPSWAPPVRQKFSWRERFIELRKVIGIGLLFFAVIGGMYLGWATPTEAAGVGAFGAFILGIAMRRLHFKNIVASCWETVKAIGMMSILLGMAALFITFVTRAGLVNALGDFFSNLHVSQFVFLIIVSILYLILGMFMGAIAMMVLTLPFVYPGIVALDINVVWFGILFMIYAEIASISPPFGVSVYGMKAALGDFMGLWDIFKGCFFFLWLWILILLILIIWPQISLFLPDLMMNY